MSPVKSCFSKILLAFLISSLPVGLVANEFTPRFGIVAETHTDARRAAVNTANSQSANVEEEDTRYLPYIGFAFSEKTPTINAEIDVQIEREIYANETFTPENFYRIDGFIDYEVIPGRMIWAVEDAGNKRRIDITRAGTADNYQNFNVFSTGPDLFFTRGANEIVVKGRISDVFYSDEVTDNLRFTLSGAMQRAISPVSKFGLEGEAALVRFKNEGFPDNYDLVSVKARYDRETPWGMAGLRGGYNTFLFDNGDQEDAPLVESYLEVGDDFSVHYLSLSASYIFTDPAAEVFDPLYSRLFEVDGLSDVDADERGGTGATKAKKAEASYEWRGQRSNARVFGFLRDLDRPDNDDLSVREVGGGGGFSYDLTENLSLWVSYYQFNSDFFNAPAGLIPILDQQGNQIGVERGVPLEYVSGSSASVGFNWHITEALLFSLGVATTTEDSNDPLREFTDDSVSLRLDYRGIGINR